jgi:hypothetical protein
VSTLLAALASVPRIARSLELLATAFTEINKRATKARASSRRIEKDDEVDQRIAALVDVDNGGVSYGKTGKFSEADGASRVSCGCSSCTCVHG